MQKNTAVLLTLVSATLFTQAAGAGDAIRCSGADYRFTGQVTQPGTETKATLQIRGERAPRNLTCIFPATQSDDEVFTITSCYESRRGGYYVDVQTHGVLGRTTAQIEVSTGNDTTKPVATLTCEAR